MLKKINWKTVVLAFIIELVISIIYPMQTSINQSVTIGFPYNFFTIYKNIFYERYLINASYFDVGSFAIDIIIVYIILKVTTILLKHIKEIKKRNIDKEISKN